MARKREAIEVGSGDVFVDLGFADAGERKLRVQLAMQVNGLIARRRLTQAKAAALLGIPGIVLAVLGILALLGWGIYLVADHHPPVYLILWMITTIIWAGKFVQEWRETRRFPWFTAGIVAFTVLAALSTVVMLAGAGGVAHVPRATSGQLGIDDEMNNIQERLISGFAAYLIKLYSRRRRQRKAHA